MKKKNLLLDTLEYYEHIDYSIRSATRISGVKTGIKSDLIHVVYYSMRVNQQTYCSQVTIP